MAAAASEPLSPEAAAAVAAAETAVAEAKQAAAANSAALGSVEEDYEALKEGCDVLPKAAEEGSVLPEATFAPAENYEHSTTHAAVMALYDLVGACVSSNTDEMVADLAAAAAVQPVGKAGGTTMAAAAVAAAAASPARGGEGSGGTTATGTAAAAAAQKAAGGGSPSKWGGGAWFPESPSTAAPSSAPAAATAVAASPSKQQQAEQQQGETRVSDCLDLGDEALGLDELDIASTAPASSAPSGSKAGPKGQPQQQQPPSPAAKAKGAPRLTNVAGVHWYDARARCAIKRVAHWLRVPWAKVRAFEQMWAMQALQLDPTSQPAYQASSKAVQYLKIGAATLGGGALLAVTGGLAAPAIAAGLGAAVTLLHGGAAAAAAVSAVASSAGGIAATTGECGGCWVLLGLVRLLCCWDSVVYMFINPTTAIASTHLSDAIPPLCPPNTTDALAARRLWRVGRERHRRLGRRPLRRRQGIRLLGLERRTVYRLRLGAAQWRRRGERQSEAHDARRDDDL